MKPRHDWSGIVVVIFAVALSLGFVSVLILSALPKDPDPLSDNGFNLLALIAGGMISTVSTYLGVRARHHPETEDDEAAAPAPDDTLELPPSRRHDVD